MLMAKENLSTLYKRQALLRPPEIKVAPNACTTVHHLQFMRRSFWRTSLMSIVPSIFAALRQGE
jgi:hypothetical protein